MKTNKKKKFNKKKFIILLLIIYLIVMSFYYVYKRPLKNIIVEGNIFLKDSDIITSAGIKDNAKILFLSKKSIADKLKKKGLINNVTITKNILSSTLTIKIEEAKILFFNKLSNSYVLDNSIEIDNQTFNGVPTLVNFIPSDVYKELIKKMKDIDINIIYDISEIEYINDPVDDKFLLLMNDGNYVYINLINFENLVNYETIYKALDDDKKGVLNLDSSLDYNSKDLNILFQTFELLKKENSEVKESELSQ